MSTSDGIPGQLSGRVAMTCIISMRTWRRTEHLSWHEIRNYSRDHARHLRSYMFYVSTSTSRPRDAKSGDKAKRQGREAY